MRATTGLTRRAFLAAATTTAVTFSGCPARLNTARVIPGRLSPNEKLRIAGIGVGGKGKGDILSCAEEEIVALCDVDWKRAEEAFYKLPKARKYKDFRKMLEEMSGEIDACVISTPDHTHAPAAFEAMKLGKHVRVQKPLTHTIAEARLLQKTAQEMGVVTAMGNQGHSGDAVRSLCEVIWDGAIGQVHEVHAWTNRPIWPQGRSQPLPKAPAPATMEWECWIGPAPMRAYNPGYAPFNWRGWWDFGCGAIGDMACHILDAAFWALRLDLAPSYSVEVVQQEKMNRQTAPIKSIIKYTFPARPGMDPVDLYWYDGGLLPPRPEGIAPDTPLGDDKNGSYFIGTAGGLTCGTRGENLRLFPEDRFQDYSPPTPTIPRIPGEDSYRNWIAACKTGAQASSHFDYAAPLTEVANMGNVALWSGEKIIFDVASMRITNCRKANDYLTKSYRKGWALPC